MPRICSVEWCERVHYAKGFCDKHFYQMKRYGKILPPPEPVVFLPGEEWRPVVGYEGKYEVSNLGRVKSSNYQRRGFEKILSPKSNTGYLRVELRGGDSPREKCVHALVAEAFIPNPENKSEVNHLDGNGFNNKVSNLEWVTRSENAKHSVYVLGNNPRKWSKTPVRCIETGEIFETQVEAAKAYRTSQGAIGNSARKNRSRAGGCTWEFVLQR